MEQEGTSHSKLFHKKNIVRIVLFTISFFINVSGFYAFVFPEIFPSKENTIVRVSKVPKPSPQVLSTTGSQWKTYWGQRETVLYSLKFPASWLQEKDILYPFGKENKSRVLLASGKKHTQDSGEQRVYPAGIAHYNWNILKDTTNGYASFSVQDTYFIFEAKDIPLEKSLQVEESFHKILNTLRIENPESAYNSLKSNLTVREKVLSPNRTTAAIVKKLHGELNGLFLIRADAQETFESVLFASFNPDVSWVTQSVLNWSEDGTYLFLHAQDATGDDLYIFNVKEGTFENNKQFLRGAQLGLPKKPFQSVSWSAPHDLLIKSYASFPWNKTYVAQYILNIEKQTVRRKWR